MKRMNKYIVIAIALAVTLGAQVRTAGAAVFTENFESPAWPGTGALSSSPTNGWIMRYPPAYAISSAPSPQNQVLQAGSGNLNVYITAGKPHGVTPTSNALELSGQIALTDFNTLGELWLADANQNGYGIYLWRGNYNQASIVKFEGSTTPFGGIPNWMVQQGEHSSTTVSVGAQDDGFIEYHLRLQQSAPGAPMTLTLWFTNSNIAATSPQSPAMQLVDDGSGSVFFNNGFSQIDGHVAPTFTAPFDLTSLQYAAFTFQTPIGFGQIDNIMVFPVVPEPSTVVLFATGGLVIVAGLRRRRASRKSQ